MGMVLGIIAIIVLLAAIWFLVPQPPPAGPRPAADRTTTAGNAPRRRPSRLLRRPRPFPTESNCPALPGKPAKRHHPR
jgi:hypothetical protein